MLTRRLLAAAAALGLLGLAAWLPTRVGANPGGQSPTALPVDLARPALSPPSALPLQAPGSTQAVEAFLYNLAAAGQADSKSPQPPAALVSAYSYLDPSWQKQLPFDAFRQQWEPVAHLDLLQVLSAGADPANPRARRVWVEFRAYEQRQGRSSVVFYEGTFTARPTESGWKLLKASLEPEDLLTVALRNQQTWRKDPVAVARAFAAARLGVPVEVRSVTRRGLQATVFVAPRERGQPLRVSLAELVDHSWKVIEAGQA